MRRLGPLPGGSPGLAVSRPGTLGRSSSGRSSSGSRSLLIAVGADAERPASERGFSLVEVLVALVITCVGLLGVGQLMLMGLQTAASALMRTQAVYLLNDMMERIRANPSGRDAYDCATYAPAPTERGCAPSGIPAVPCTARELAEDELARWQQQARQALPLRTSGPCDANVRYFADAAEPGVARYEVELTWYERGQDAPSSLTGVLLITSDVRA